MHADTFAVFTHEHQTPQRVDRHEQRTRWVVGLTVAMMVGELVVGSITGSMALTADGWHMATHAGALGLAAAAYWFARTRAGSAAFSFGTGKVYPLAGYTSAIALAMVALAMAWESVWRLFEARPIAFDQALPVAVLGLVVNLLSAWLLGHDHDHDQHDDHDHGHHDHDHEAEHHHEGHGHDDHNLRAAYLHVLADALTSVLAIAALVGGRWFGWTALDPLMGIVGGAVILHWSWGLCRGSARQLLDVSPSERTVDAIRRALESVDDVKVADLHLWEMGPGRTACIVSLVTSSPREPRDYQRLVAGAAEVHHVTVEVHRCPHHGEEPCLATAG